ncbi:MAG TPA: lysozyme inhibitor LprI family protein [Terriglobales bacterium]|jgi:uncharacterized protein YecT (DUF1311 family)|nr:lysozyme inhibitor LprI family protein [Terriglobales bacterium]
MRNLAIVVFFLVNAVYIFPQNSQQYGACTGKAKAQPELNACAAQEADRVDAKMNGVYKQLLAKAGSDANDVAKIKAAERTWLAYRDAYIEATYPATDKQAEYGSMYLMDVNLLRAKLTQQHIADLEELLKQY